MFSLKSCSFAEFKRKYLFADSSLPFSAFSFLFLQIFRIYFGFNSVCFNFCFIFGYDFSCCFGLIQLLWPFCLFLFLLVRLFQISVHSVFNGIFLVKYSPFGEREMCHLKEETSSAKVMLYQNLSR